MTNHVHLLSLTALLACAVCAPAHAGITRIVIDRIEASTFAGLSFGDTGQYEKLSGRAFGEVDPANPLHADIPYIKEAPRNARGHVEYAVDISIIKPADPAKGNGTLFYDVVNRGSRRAFDVFHVGAPGGNDPSTAADSGDGFLLRQGYTLVVSGWQGDVLRGGNRFIASYPVPTRGGKPITKTITAEFIVTQPTYTLSIGWDNGGSLRPHPAVESGMANAQLIKRTHAHAVDEVIPRDQWSFGRCPDGKTITPTNVDLCLPEGFSGDYVYYLVYEAQDPLVMGLAFAATRDIVSFLRYDTSPANPLVAHSGRARQPNTIRRAIGFGRSQSGRFVKDFVYRGFNQDEAKRIVFDGVITLTGGSRRTNVMEEFSMPGRFSTPLVGHFSAGDQFPFTYETLRDPITGRSDGWLRKCREQAACPKIMHWDSATEAWGARASLVATDPLGKFDVAIPANVRIYYFASTQHVPATVEGARICQNLTNPNPYKEGMRALLVAMQNWIDTGKSPRPSGMPTLAAGELARPLPASEFGFPQIPGHRYTGEANHLFVNDESVQPPRHVPDKQYAVYVPKVDRDGNEIGGIRSVALQVPLGTYMGWNLRRKGYMEDRSCYLNGSFIPFSRKRAERGDDPRLSLEERYGSKEKYVALVEAAVKRMQQEGFLLADDAERVIADARKQELGF